MRIHSLVSMSALLVALLLPEAPGQPKGYVPLRSLRNWHDQGRVLMYVRSAGDADGDGVADLLAHYQGGWYCGYCSPILEVVSGLSNRPIARHRWPGERDSASPTGGEADVADIDGDGRLELVMGQDGVPSPFGTALGMVQVVSLDGSRAYWRRYADDGVGHFGIRLRTAGDLDGDGRDDIMVYSLSFPGRRGFNAGQVTVLSGRDGTTLYEYRGVHSGEGFGSNLHQGVGDVDGDGHGDFAIGSVDRRPPGDPDAKGIIWIYSGATGSLIWEIDAQSGDIIGAIADGPGDIDRDGRADLIVPGRTKVFAYSGRDLSLLWEWPFPEVSPGAVAVTHTRDDDGDGIPEILVSSSAVRHDGYADGSVSQLSGATGRLRLEADYPDQDCGGNLGRGLVAVGDTNGDGLDDFVSGTWGDYNCDEFRQVLFMRESLRVIPSHSQQGDADLHLVVPSSPGRAFALFFAMSGRDGVPLGARCLPLDPDPLLLWSIQHPFWGTLDARGEALVALGPGFLGGGTTAGEFSCAGVVLDPLALLGIKTVTNRAVVALR